MNRHLRLFALLAGLSAQPSLAQTLDQRMCRLNFDACAQELQNTCNSLLNDCRKRYQDDMRRCVADARREFDRCARALPPNKRANAESACQNLRVREKDCTAPHRAREIELFCTPYAVRCPSRERCDVPFQICMRDNAPRPPQPQPAPAQPQPQPPQGDARPAPAPAEPLQAAPVQPSPPPPAPVQRASPQQGTVDGTALLAALRPRDTRPVSWHTLLAKRKVDDPSTCYSGLALASLRENLDKSMDVGIWVNFFVPAPGSTDTAAERAGVRRGDQIFGIDGISTKGMSGEEAMVRSDKPMWDPLRLVLQSEGQREIREVTVSCASR